MMISFLLEDTKPHDIRGDQNKQSRSSDTMPQTKVQPEGTKTAPTTNGQIAPTEVLDFTTARQSTIIRLPLDALRLYQQQLQDLYDSQKDWETVPGDPTDDSDQLPYNKTGKSL